MIIGVTGTFSSGKDTVANYLIAKGLAHFSTADELRSLVSAAGLSHERAVLHDFATKLREQEGQDVLERRIYPRITGDADVTALRTVAGITFLRSQGHFYLIAVNAPIELRFERALVRGRAGDGKTLEEFAAQEDAERRGKAHQLDAVIGMADYHIINNGSLEELHQQINHIYQEIKDKDQAQKSSNS